MHKGQGESSFPVQLLLGVPFTNALVDEVIEVPADSTNNSINAWMTRCFPAWLLLGVPLTNVLVDTIARRLELVAIQVPTDSTNN